MTVVESHVSARAPARLVSFLDSWIGRWPPQAGADVFVWEGRDRPGWDGGTWLGLGAVGPEGLALSLSPRFHREVAQHPASSFARAVASTDPQAALAYLLNDQQLGVSRSILRWSEEPADLPAPGVWVAPNNPDVPSWLRSFPDPVLIAYAPDGQVAAAVGIKPHNGFGQELAVVTAPEYRGQGWARLLVAQAARDVLRDGILPMYLHLPDNIASARVAEASGFADHGWRVIGLHRP